MKIFSYKVKSQLQFPGKIYCVDPSFINHFGFKFSEDKGRLMENVVAIHLFRKFGIGKKTKVFIGVNTGN